MINGLEKELNGHMDCFRNQELVKNEILIWKEDLDYQWIFIVKNGFKERLWICKWVIENNGSNGYQELDLNGYLVYGYLVRRLTFMGLSRLGYALWTPEPPTLANLLQHGP